MDTKDSNDAQLHKVAIDGNLEEARTLILNGANIEAHCFCLETPLHKAAFNGNLEVVEFLIQKGAICCIKTNCTIVDKSQNRS